MTEIKKLKDHRRAAADYGLLFFLELISVLWMWSGISFSGASALTESGLSMLRYFTVDSNILMGIAAGAMCIFHLQVCRGKRESIPAASYCWNLAATAGVALTMIVTACFLSPSFGEKWPELYADSNFLLHLADPVLAVLFFILREKEQRKCFPATLSGLIPVAVYAVFYYLNARAHAVDGIVPASADWYGFLITGRIKAAPVVVLCVFTVTWLISFGIWALQQRRAGTEKDA